MLPSLCFHWLLILIHWNARICVGWLNELNFLRWPLDIIGIHKWIVHLSMTFLNFLCKHSNWMEFLREFSQAWEMRRSFENQNANLIRFSAKNYTNVNTESVSSFTRNCNQKQLFRVRRCNSTFLWREQDCYTTRTFLHIKEFYKQMKLRCALLDQQW